MFVWALAVLFAMGVGRADAQVSGAANSTTGSSCSASNNADRSCQFSVDAISSGPTSVSSRYRWNISTDVGSLGSASMSGTAQHNVSFNVTMNGGYRLDLTQQRIGEMRRVDDCGTICIGDNGTANVSGVTGSQTGGTVTSGSLNLADVADNPAKNTAININQSQAATIHAVSNGAAHAHSLSFVQSGGTSSASDETALRMGAGSTVTGCTICGNRSPDTDGHFVSVTVVPLCGNGIIDGSVSEQCDEGGNNGTPGSCCTVNCTLKTAGTPCRGAAGACDAAEACDGANGACPPDLFEPPTTVCRPTTAGEVCDVAETCTGSGPNCPADDVLPNGSVCRTSQGDCDPAEACNGVSKLCPADAKSSGVCRPAAGDCDVAESCDGVGDSCPADDFKSSSVTCRTAAGVCDLAEQCTGSSAACPADLKSTAPCRSAAGVCDVAESCNGVDDDCPADDFEPPTTACRTGTPGEACDATEYCTGSGVNCPADEVLPNGSVCRTSQGDCDPSEACDGSSKYCPADGKSTAVCRPSAGDCDVAEACDGVNDDCPADGFEPATTVCRAVSGGEACDIAETCTGSSADCPADAVEPNTTVCRGAAGDCDIAETCDGSSKLCPADVLEPSGTVCRAASSGEVCDTTETCTGGSAACPADAVLPNGTPCRSSQGVCDPAEACDGSSKVCPTDAKSTAQCRPQSGVCDVAESCDGVGNDCPADASAPNGTPCDDTLFCNGTQICTGGVCGGGTSPCGLGESCNESADLCFSGDCPVSPDSCRAAAKNRVVIKNNTSDDTKDRLVWKWTKGDATTQMEFGDPTTTADYALCLYAGATPTLLQQANVPPSGTKWSLISDKGYKYTDKNGDEDGITKIIVKGGTAGKSKAIVKGKGANLPDFDSDLPIATGDLPLIVQLRNNQTGICWGGSFATAKKNEATQFNAKTP